MNRKAGYAYFDAFRAALIALALTGSAAAGTPEADRAVAFMRQTIGFSEAQVASVEAGQVVTKQLPAADKPEIAAFGAVRVQGDRAPLLSRLRADIGQARRGTAVLNIGRFSRPPRVEDLAPLTLDDDDMAALRECKPGDCSIKLSRSAMGRVQREVDWKAPDARTRGSQVLKEMLVEYVSAYMKGGTQAMAIYADKEAPVEASAEFRKLLAASQFLFEYLPALHRYAEEYPAGSLAGAEDFFYWCKDKYAPKP